MKLIALNLFIICIASVYAQNANYPDYMPLSVGNKWQYLQVRYDFDGTTIYVTYDTPTKTIKNSFTTNGTTWYIVGNDTISYSRQSGELYVNSRHKMDFSQSVEYSFGDTLIKETIKSNFDSSLTCRGYDYNNENSEWKITANAYYAASLGQISEYYCKSPHGEFKWNSSNSELFKAIIYDSSGNPHYYSDHFKPEIRQVGIALHENQNLTYQLSIKHRYQYLSGKYRHPDVAPWTFQTGNNFIDSAAFQSYYSLGASIIQCPPVVIKKTDPDNDYTFQAVIDTNLLKSGYVFNYRVMAVDLGIIPGISYLPDTGWSTYRWGDVLSSKETEKSKKDFVLYQNYPNPFNPATTIRIYVPQREAVSVKVYDALGREIRTLINEELAEGEYRVVFNAANLSSGFYYCRMTAGNNLQTNKMLLLK